MSAIQRGPVLAARRSSRSAVSLASSAVLRNSSARDGFSAASRSHSADSARNSAARSAYVGRRNNPHRKGSIKVPSKPKRARVANRTAHLMYVRDGRSGDRSMAIRSTARISYNQPSRAKVTRTQALTSHTETRSCPSPSTSDSNSERFLSRVSPIAVT